MYQKPWRCTGYLKLKARIIVILNLKKMFNKFIQRPVLSIVISLMIVLLGVLQPAQLPITFIPIYIASRVKCYGFLSGERITNCWLNRWSFRWKERLTEFQGWSTSFLMQVMMEKETIQAIFNCRYRSGTRRRWMFKTVASWLIISCHLLWFVKEWRLRVRNPICFCMSIFIVKIRKADQKFHLIMPISISFGIEKVDGVGVGWYFRKSWPCYACLTETGPYASV